MPTGATVTFTVNQGGVNRLLHDEGGEYGQYLVRTLNRITNEAKARANVDTGLMRSRIEYRVITIDGALGGEVAAATSYSYYVHQGARGRTGNPFLLDAARAVLGG